MVEDLYYEEEYARLYREPKYKLVRGPLRLYRVSIRRRVLLIRLLFFTNFREPFNIDLFYRDGPKE